MTYEQLLEQNKRYRKALEDIIDNAPEEEPDLYDDWGMHASWGNYDDVASDARDHQHWYLAGYARAAFKDNP